MKFLKSTSEYHYQKSLNQQLKYMNKFTRGIKAFKPSEKAPGYVKGNFHITRDELIQWLNEQPGTFRLVLKESEKGPWYLMVDDYQPKQEPKQTDPADDLPF